ncbi:hypothetical protein [Corynebacterium spheniscorum]|uniref:Uncharacterized protein n=1 Tax=Corynebacterium spheniscorum TaxID=185761 RepID=A0A1I2TD48_9CORY|nr:hypothetical protein [Corynebacterium spheniscorum]SFG62812.1 hypothetical protein SAMN05660282_01431 [Corynebacterium spheniscorum]
MRELLFHYKNFRHHPAATTVIAGCATLPLLAALYLITQRK